MVEILEGQDQDQEISLISNSLFQLDVNEPCLAAAAVVVVSEDENQGEDKKFHVEENLNECTKETSDLELSSTMITLKRENEEDFVEFDPSLYVRASLSPEPQASDSLVEEADSSHRDTEDESEQATTEDEECVSPALILNKVEPDEPEPFEEDVGMEMGVYPGIDIGIDAGVVGGVEEIMNYGFPDANEDRVVTVTGRPVLEYVIQMRRGLDTVITLKDGQLGAHRMVLTAASPFIGDILREQNSKARATLVIPDVTTRTMERLLNLAYTGRMYFAQDESEEIFSAMQCLYFAEFADLSLVKVVKRKKPACSFDVGGFLGPPPDESIAIPVEKEDEQELDTEADTDIKVDTSSASQYSCVDEKTMRCNICNKSYSAQKNLIHHLETVHGSVIEKTTPEEMQKLTNCGICNVQWKTLERAQKHLQAKHDCTICWTCLEPVKKKDNKSHYYSCHRTDPNSLARNFTVRCRWCSRTISVKNNSNCSAINSHAQLHMPSLQTSKREAGRPSTRGESSSFQVQQVAGPSTLYSNGDSKPERVLGKICDPPNYNVDEVTKKCRIDLSNLPCLSLQLTRLSQETLDKYMTKNRNPTSTTTPKTSRSRRRMESIDSPSQKKLIAIDPIYGGYDTNEYNALESDDIFPEHFLLAPESAVSNNNGMNFSTEQDVKPVVGKKRVTAIRRRNPEKEKPAAVTIYSASWGELRFSVHDISSSLFTAKFIPAESFLLMGRVSPNFIWDRIDDMQNTRNVSILRLIPEPFEVDKYMEIYRYLCSESRIGVLTGVYTPDVADVYLYALTNEGYRKKPLTEFHGPGFLEAEGHATSLLIITILHAAVPTKAKPGPKPKKAGKVKTKIRESVKISDSIDSCLSEENLLCEAVLKSRGTIINEPAVLIAIRTPEKSSAFPHSLDSPGKILVPIELHSDEIPQTHRRILRPQETNSENLDAPAVPDEMLVNGAPEPETPVPGPAFITPAPPPASNRGRPKRRSTAASDSELEKKRIKSIDEVPRRNSTRWKQTKLSFPVSPIQSPDK